MRSRVRMPAPASRSTHRRRAAVLLAAALLLSLGDAWVRLTYRGRARIGEAPWSWLDAAAEGTLPTLFASLTMAAAGIACLRNQDAAHTAWRCLGCLCLYLAIDDLFGLHERFGAAVHAWVGQVGTYAWVVTLAPAFAAVGLWCGFRLLRALGEQPRRRACLLAGFAALGGALGLEAIEEALHDAAWRPRGLPLVAYAMWVEETLELFGPLLLFLAAPAGPSSSWCKPASPARDPACER